MNIKQWLLIYLLIHFYFMAHAKDTKVSLVVKNLDQPVWLTATKKYPNYLFIVEKKGKVMIFDKSTKSLLEQPFLDVRDKINIEMQEQGLLGLAFDPNFSITGRYYVYLTNNEGDTEILRFVAELENGKWQTESSQGELLLGIKQDFRNHNGGWLGFGPDGALYIATGDGGSANDPKNRSQDLNSHLGKILRLDVSTQTGYSTKGNPFVGQKGAQPEIYAYGLRNPWRCAWDGDDLYIGDVGQKDWEEINKVSFKQLRKANFGWPIYEGDNLNKAKRRLETPKNTVAPVYTFAHGRGKDEGYSINGGFVYRGPITSLQGKYFFSDWINMKIWSLPSDNMQKDKLEHWSKKLKYRFKVLSQLVSFGEDVEKNLYLISHNGEIYQIIENN